MAKGKRLPSWSDETGWTRVFKALPDPVRPTSPMSVQEEWRRLEGFDVHLDRWLAPGARAKIVMLHGGGGHGRLLGALAWRLALHGFETICPDLPGYGVTRGRAKSSIRYDDWREVAAGLMAEERARGGALFVYGLSMGGMLAYDAVVMTGKADGLIASCFLDPTRKNVRRSIVRQPWMAGLIDPLFALTPRLFNGLPIPMALTGNMRAISNSAAVTEAIVADRLAGGNSMPTGFLRTWLQAPPLAPPESFDACPVLMVHPAADRWTDVSVSDDFFSRLAVQKRRVMLENCGHFPIQAPGSDQHDHAIAEFIGAIVERRPMREVLV